MEEEKKVAHCRVGRRPGALEVAVGDEPDRQVAAALGAFFGFGKKGLRGPSRESNPGPPAPKAGIIPLDQTATSFCVSFYL